MNPINKVDVIYTNEMDFVRLHWVLEPSYVIKFFKINAIKSTRTTVKLDRERKCSRVFSLFFFILSTSLLPHGPLLLLLAHALSNAF